MSLESSVQSNATELPLLIVSISFIWPKESYKDQIDFLFVTSQSSILLLTLPPKM